MKTARLQSAANKVPPTLVGTRPSGLAALGIPTTHRVRQIEAAMKQLAYKVPVQSTADFSRHQTFRSGRVGHTRTSADKLRPSRSKRLINTLPGALWFRKWQRIHLADSNQVRTPSMTGS